MTECCESRRGKSTAHSARTSHPDESKVNQSKNQDDCEAALRGSGRLYTSLSILLSISQICAIFTARRAPPSIAFFITGAYRTLRYLQSINQFHFILK